MGLNLYQNAYIKRTLPLESFAYLKKTKRIIFYIDGHKDDLGKIF